LAQYLSGEIKDYVIIDVNNWSYEELNVLHILKAESLKLLQPHFVLIYQIHQTLYYNSLQNQIGILGNFRSKHIRVVNYKVRVSIQLSPETRHREATK